MVKNELENYPVLVVDSENIFAKEQIKTIVSRWGVKVGKVTEEIVIDQPKIVVTTRKKIEKICSGDYVVFIGESEQEQFPERCESIVLKKPIKEDVLAKILISSSEKIVAENEQKMENEHMKEKIEELERENAEFNNNLRNTEKMQRALMVQEIPGDDLDFGLKYMPLMKISGDVIYTERFENKICIMLADVTDHGPFAGSYGTTLYALAKAYILGKKEKDVDVVEWAKYMASAAQLSRPPLKDWEPIMQLMTATATFCIIDIASETAEFVMCGSGEEPPIVIGESECKTIYDKDVAYSKIGAPLGTKSAKGEYRIGERITIPFTSKEKILLYSDGLTELFADVNESKVLGKTYSTGRIIRNINSCVKKGQISSKEIIESIMNDISLYSISTNINEETLEPNLTDDLTIVCVGFPVKGGVS